MRLDALQPLKGSRLPSEEECSIPPFTPELALSKPCTAIALALSLVLSTGCATTLSIRSMQPGVVHVGSTNHMVLIVGWDDTATHSGGQGAWIVKNSWGTGWGDAGYFKMAYGSAGTGTFVSYMTEWQPYDADGDLLYYDEAG